MKDLAKSLILKQKAYRAALQPDSEFDGGCNSQEYEDAIVQNVETLLKDMAYLRNIKKDPEVFSIYHDILTTDILFYTGMNGEFGTFCVTKTVYSVLLQEEGFNRTTFLQAFHSGVSSCALCYLCKFYLHCLQVLNVF